MHSVAAQHIPHNLTPDWSSHSPSLPFISFIQLIFVVSFSEPVPLLTVEMPAGVAQIASFSVSVAVSLSVSVSVSVSVSLCARRISVTDSKSTPHPSGE